MKGSTIAAMIMAAAAASAATVFALKKAHDKKLENACNCDDLPEGGCCFDETDDDVCDCTDTDETTDEAPEASESTCCANGVCSLDTDDDTADQPVQIQMPENLDDDTDSNAEQKSSEK